MDWLVHQDLRFFGCGEKITRCVLGETIQPYQTKYLTVFQVKSSQRTQKHTTFEESRSLFYVMMIGLPLKINIQNDY